VSGWHPSPQNFHEHDDHHRFFNEPFVVKGAEAARACAAVIAAVASLRA
jgi:6,7-dimethyl-8-ribityllumazine synthase